MKSGRKIPSQADITSEQLLINPETDGISGVPAISHGFYRTNWQSLPEHTHDTMELCFCSRGSLVFEIADVIRKRPGHCFKISDFAAHAKLSESRFTALFRQIVGLPPYAYLADVRLKRAKEMLLESDMSIGRLAARLTA